MINIKIGHPQTQVELKARKTLDGNLLILDHDMIDIALIPLENKVMSFPIVPETPQLNSMQAAVYVISHFLITEKEARQTAADYEDNLEKYFLKPSDQDSTEWGEVPQQAEKGAMVPGYYYIPLRYRY